MNTLMRKNPDFLSGIIENLLVETPVYRNHPAMRGSVPAVNIKNSDAAFEIEVAAPGLQKDDFNIELENNYLKLSVNKSSEKEEVKENYTRKEFNYFNFERSFALPKNIIETDNVQANYTDGILKITLPKQETKETVKKVSVQ